MIQTLTELLAKAERSVTHLELRDSYGVTPGHRAWLNGTSVEEFARTGVWQPWLDLVRGHVERGVAFRRARVVSEPWSDCIRYEVAATPYTNLAGGEQVRWLPRPQAKDIALPGCDFWQIVDGLVCWVYQSGDGEPTGHEVTTDDTMAKLCSTAFKAVWQRAIDHEEYRPA